MLQGLESVKAKLKKPDQGVGNASERAAEVILRMLRPAIAEPNLSQAPELWG
jgi:hypothetical protein